LAQAQGNAMTGTRSHEESFLEMQRNDEAFANDYLDE
jgi:hypothetical protein